MFTKRRNKTIYQLFNYRFYIILISSISFCFRENSEKLRKKDDSKDVADAKEKYMKKEEVKDDDDKKERKYYKVSSSLTLGRVLIFLSEYYKIQIKIDYF